MVKFGRHQKYFLEHEHRDDSFVVPYNKTKSQIEEDSVEFTADDFVKQWQNYLEQARQEFDTSVGRAWQRVFATLHDVHTEEARGAPPEKALVLFATTAPSQKTVVEVLDIFKSIHATALVNAEALRKLVKKFDKHQLKQAADNADSSSSSTMESLSCQLLPQVYAANFVVGLASIHQAVELLRSELGLGEYAAATTNTEAEAQLEMTPSSTTTTCLTSPKHKPSATSKRNFMPSPGFPSDRDEKKDDPNNNNGQPQQQQQVVLDSKTAADENIPIDDGASMEQAMGGLQFQRLTLQDRKDSHAEHTELVDRRRLELQWLRQSIQRIDQFGFCANLVAHRGFHSPKDRSDRRPLENSLQAYETAWTSGIHLCECDIALTKDEKLILAHDDSFIRLALDDMCEKSKRLVRDLTFQEIMSVALTSGSRPPLLLDVLQSAHAIGGNAKLIIEIKPGNREAASALARLFAQYPHLMAHCAVVMSFDSFAMHSLQEELDALLGTASTTSEQTNIHQNHRRSYSLGIFPSPSAMALNAMMGAPGAGDPYHHHHHHQNEDNNQHIQQENGNNNNNNSNHQNGTSPRQGPRNKRYPRPKLLILTVCESPKKDVELQVSVGDEDIHKLLQGWVKGLDGVYMQYEPKMLTPEGQAVLAKLAKLYDVGVWNHRRPEDPDDYATFSTLVQKGQVSYVNSDLPREFFQNELSEHGIDPTDNSKHVCV